MTLNCCKFEFSENFTRFGRQHLLSRSRPAYCQRMRCKALNVGYFLDIMFLALICCGFLRYRGPSYTRTAVARFPYLYLGFVVKCLKPKPIKSKTTLLWHILIIAWLDNNTLIHNNSVQAGNHNWMLLQHCSFISTNTKVDMCYLSACITTIKSDDILI